MKYLQHLTTSILLLFTITSFAQTTTRLKRVVLEEYNSSKNTYISTDSTEYYYSPGNAGVISTNTIIGASNPFLRFKPMNYFQGMAYDSAILFERHINNQGKPSQKNFQTINSNKRIDAYDQFRLNVVNKLVHTDTITNTYTNSTLTQMTVSKWGSTKRMTEFIYNINNMIDTVRTTSLSGSTVTTVYSYDVSNRLVGTTNKYTSSQYSSQTKINYVYASNPNLPDFIVTTRNTLNPPKFDTTSVKAFIYNANNHLIQEKFWEYNWPNKPSPTLTYQLDIQYDNQNKRITDVIWEDFFKHGPQFAGFIKHLRKQYTYNQDDKLETYNIDHWDSTTNSWKPKLDTALGMASKTRFEYEIYWPASISEQQKQSNNINLFPSPASDFITINTTFGNQQNFIATIVDMQGRVLRQWKETGIQEYNRVVPLTELPPGVYILKLSGDGIDITKQFSITK